MKENSYIAQNIDTGVWKISAGGNLYILRISETIVIDTGDRSRRKDAEFVERVIDPRNVKKVIFTHLHYDHSGNFDLFPNAEFYASKEEIESFRKDPEGTVLDNQVSEKLKSIELKPAESLKIPELEIISTPGHTKGSICIFFREKGLLFSGDTIFRKRIIGRTDLPTSAPEEINKSLMKLVEYPFRIILPGHEY